MVLIASESGFLFGGKSTDLPLGGPKGAVEVVPCVELPELALDVLKGQRGAVWSWTLEVVG
jgi:hypothetical protein